MQRILMVQFYYKFSAVIKWFSDASWVWLSGSSGSRTVSLGIIPFHFSTRFMAGIKGEEISYNAIAWFVFCCSSVIFVMSPDRIASLQAEKCAGIRFERPPMAPAPPERAVNAKNSSNPL